VTVGVPIACADEPFLALVLYAQGMVSGAIVLVKSSSCRQNLSSDDVCMDQIEDHDPSISFHIRRMQLQSKHTLITLQAFVLILYHNVRYPALKFELWMICAQL
jgi:hypothetical protein